MKCRVGTLPRCKVAATQGVPCNSMGKGDIEDENPSYSVTIVIGLKLILSGR